MSNSDGTPGPGSFEKSGGNLLSAAENSAHTAALSTPDPPAWQTHEETCLAIAQGLCKHACFLLFFFSQATPLYFEFSDLSSAVADSSVTTASLQTGVDHMEQRMGNENSKTTAGSIVKTQRVVLSEHTTAWPQCKLCLKT